MNFELGKSYIVEVTEKGIMPSMEFDRSQWFNKDYDNLEFLTDEEKEVIVKDVLAKIRAEIIKKQLSIVEGDVFNNGRIYGYEEVLDIIDKYTASPTRAESEENKRMSISIDDTIADQRKTGIYGSCAYTEEELRNEAEQILYKINKTKGEKQMMVRVYRPNDEEDRKKVLDYTKELYQTGKKPMGVMIYASEEDIKKWQDKADECGWPLQLYILSVMNGYCQYLEEGKKKVMTLTESERMNFSLDITKLENLSKMEVSKNDD